jgi:hypothetical protein
MNRAVKPSGPGVLSGGRDLITPNLSLGKYVLQMSDINPGLVQLFQLYGSEKRQWCAQDAKKEKARVALCSSSKTS